MVYAIRKSGRRGRWSHCTSNFRHGYSISKRLFKLTRFKSLFSLIPEAVVHINFTTNLARFFRAPILYYIDNHIENLAKFMGKHLCWNHFLMKLQASGLPFY